MNLMNEVKFLYMVENVTWCILYNDAVWWNGIILLADTVTFNGKIINTMLRTIYIDKINTCITVKYNPYLVSAFSFWLLTSFSSSVSSRFLLSNSWCLFLVSLSWSLSSSISFSICSSFVFCCWFSFLLSSASLDISVKIVENLPMIGQVPRALVSAINFTP